MDWLAEAQELAQAGQPFALATVVRRVAPASAQPGAKALILPDGSMRGWVGGSCAQPVVTSEARQALRDGTPRLLRLGQMPGLARARARTEKTSSEYPMTCHSGGALEILIEPVLPAPRLVIVGETPVVADAGDLARVMGYRVDQFDRAADLALRARRLGGAGVRRRRQHGRRRRGGAGGGAARGQPHTSRWSPVRNGRRSCARRSRRWACPPDDLARLKAPAGLDIGARDARGDRAQHHGRDRPGALGDDARDIGGDIGPGPPESALELEAIDPVCGMTVTIAGARHQTEYDGKIWYFCCGGCKARFEADPLQYSAA